MSATLQESASIEQRQNKRKKIGSGAQLANDDDDLVVLAANGKNKKPSIETHHQHQQRQKKSSKKKAEEKLSSVYLVFRCEVSVYKRNVDDTMTNTEVLGVFVNRRDANMCAKCAKNEVYQDSDDEAYQDSDDEDDEVNDEDDDDGLFEWESELYDGWTKDRVWVEHKLLQYSF